MSLGVPRTLRPAIVISALALQAPAATVSVEPVRVIVSRREVRVVFPTDSARAWGWSDRKDPDYFPAYVWGIGVDGMDGPRFLDARVDRQQDEARNFPSLEQLVAAARAELCLPGMMARCDSSGTRVSVEDGRVVLTLRDSARIARLFGLRPALVSAWLHRPEDHEAFARDSARVDYIAPEIPLPDAATREDAARSQRRYEASISMISRYVASGKGWQWGPLWLEVGDSAAVYVTERKCHHDVCTGGDMPHDSGWTITNPGIARLYLVKSDSSDGHSFFIFGGKPRYVKALTPGRTTLRVRGIHSASDTAPSSTPPERHLEREVIVTPPIKRVEITPRPKTVRVLETITLRVRALDRYGREYAGLPWQLEVLDGEDRSLSVGPKPASLAFASPGRVRIAARLGVHADTITITVMPPDS